MNAITWLLLVGSAVCSSSIVLAQSSAPATTEPIRTQSFGVYGSIGLNMFGTDIAGLPGIPSCCPQYNSGSGVGFAVGGLYDYPVTSTFSILGRLSLFSAGGTITATEQELLNTDGVEQYGTFEHTIATQRFGIGLEPLAQLRVMDKLAAVLGPSIGYFFSSSFEQKEHILEPAGAVFENGQPTRFTYSGNVPDASSLFFGIVVGLRYEIPIAADSSLSVVPELTYTHGLTSLQSSQDWSLQSIRAGIAVQWNSWKKPEPLTTPPPSPEPAPEPPPPAVVLPALAVSKFEATLLDADGRPTKDSVITITNIVSTNLYALLNYVFFDDSSSVIPTRYQLLTPGEAESFDINALNGIGTMPIYYHILNIVGLKLRKSPDATITLIGCNSNVGPEEGNTALSKDRAEAIRDYLTQVWRVDPLRIKVQTRNLPADPSNTTTPDGAAENRRVEVLANDRSILEPLYFTDTTRTSSAPSIRFSQNVTSENGVKEWSVVASQGGKELKSFAGSSNVDSAVYWDMGDDIATMPLSEEPVRYTIRVVDEQGQSRVAEGNDINVQQVVRKDKRIERFTLIIFGYNVSEFTDAHERIISVIKQRISPNSTVTVEGFTDRSGEEEYNLKLSQRRADETARRLNIPKERSTGYGSNNLLYDNTLPEGRFYSRTVNVTIETPIE